MSQVLGCKVSDDLYNRFSKLDGSISDNLRKAIENYIDNMVNQSVNHVLKNFSHSQVVERVDSLILSKKALFEDSKQSYDDLSSNTQDLLRKLELLREKIQ